MSNIEKREPLNELSTELYVNEIGLLTETETHNEVIGVCLSLSDDLSEASFMYIINDNHEN